MQLSELKARYGEYWVPNESDPDSNMSVLFPTPHLFSTAWTIVNKRYNQRESDEGMHFIPGTLACLDIEWFDHDDLQDICQQVIDQYPSDSPLVTIIRATKVKDWLQFLCIPYEDGTIAWYVNVDTDSPYYQHVIRFTMNIDDVAYVGTIDHMLANMETCVLHTFDQLVETNHF